MTPPTTINKIQDNMMVYRIIHFYHIRWYKRGLLMSKPYIYFLCWMCKLLLLGLAIAAMRPDRVLSNLLFRVFFIQDHRSVLSYVICIYVCANIFVYVSSWLEFLTWSSISHSVCQRTFSLLANGCRRQPDSNPGLNRGWQLVSFRFEIPSLWESSKVKTASTYACMPLVS